MLLPETYQLMLCLVTLALTLTAGFLLGLLTNDRRISKPRSQKAGQRN